MPFTVYHVGPVLLLWSIFLSLDIVALFIGATLMDIEGFLYLFDGYPTMHGALHSILGAILVAITATAISYESRVALKQKPEISTTLVSGIIGSFSHLVLDAIMYSDVNLAWPLKWWNPLLGMVDENSILMFCAATFFFGAIILFARKQLLKKEENQ